MAKTATGVMDAPKKATKATTTTKKQTKGTTRRRGGTAIKEVPTKKAASSTKSTSKSSAKTISPAKELGIKGEEAAARYLERRGYEILDRNWSCDAGEVDIVAKDSGVIVFVEVKTLRNSERGFPSEATTEKKRERYEKIALTYLQDCAFTDYCVRFDVISIVVIASDKAMIRHHMNAMAMGC